MSIPVVIASNGIGFPVKPVAENAPPMIVATNGYGIPIVISDLGVPYIVSGVTIDGFKPSGQDSLITVGGATFRVQG